MNIPAEHHHQENNDHRKWQSVEDVRKTHHHRVSFPADKTRYRAPQNPDANRDKRGRKTNGQRDPSSDQNARQQITTERVGAEQVSSSGRPVGDFALAVSVASGDFFNDLFAIRFRLIQEFIFQI